MKQTPQLQLFLPYQSHIMQIHHINSYSHIYSSNLRPAHYVLHPALLRLFSESSISHPLTKESTYLKERSNNTQDNNRKGGDHNAVTRLAFIP